MFGFTGVWSLLVTTFTFYLSFHGSWDFVVIIASRLWAGQLRNCVLILGKGKRFPPPNSTKQVCLWYPPSSSIQWVQGKVVGFWNQSTQIKCHMYLHSMYRDLFVICVCLMSSGFICLAVSTGEVMRWLDEYEWVSGGMVVEYVFILLFCFNLWSDKDMRNESWGIKEEASFHSIQHFLYYWMHVGCVVSGFCCSVNEIFTPPVFYNMWNPRKPKMSCRLCCSCVCFSSEIKEKAIVACEGTGDAGKKILLTSWCRVFHEKLDVSAS